MKYLYLTVMLLSLSTTLHADQLMPADQELLDAAQEDSLEGMHSALKKGAHVLAKNDAGQTALMFAAFNGNSDAVRRLLNEAYNTYASNRGVNFQDASGKTALMYATVNGHNGVISILLAQGADPAIEAIDAEGIRISALSLARASLREADGAQEIAKWQTIIDLLEKKGQESTIVYPPHIVQPIPAQPPLSKEELTHQLWHELYRIGTTQKDLPILDHITSLLEQGADITSRDPKSGDTPLIFAARETNRKPLLHFLLKRKDIKINDTNSVGQTVLMLLAGNPWMTDADIDLIASLLALGAKANLQDTRGRTALMYVIRNFEKHGSINVAALELLIPKSTLQLKNNDGKTALDMAWDMLQSMHKHQPVGNLVQAIKLIEKAIEDKDHSAPQSDWQFLRNSITNQDFDKLRQSNPTVLTTANITIQEPFGKKRTALMRALVMGSDDVINALLALGPQKLSINAQDADDNTVLMYAVYANRNDIVAKLLKLSPDKTLKNKDGKTALMIAQDKGYNDIVKTLNPEASLGSKIMGIFG